MVYDTFSRRKAEEQKANYEALKQLLGSTKNGKISKYYKALEYIQQMESQMKVKDEKIKEFEGFFGLLSRLLPREFSIHDRLI